jgi:hypothetical protein
VDALHLARGGVVARREERRALLDGLPKREVLGVKAEVIDDVTASLGVV